MLTKQKVVAELIAWTTMSLVVATVVWWIEGGWSWTMGTLILMALFGFANYMIAFKEEDEARSCLFSLLLKPFPSNSVICQKNGYPIRITVGDEWHYRWSSSIRGLRTGRQATFFFKMVARPITNNPKVRELCYFVRLVSGGDIESCQKSWQHGHWNGGDRANIETMLYDLNENRSSDLAQFWNPLRAEQQRAFQDLVGEVLAPSLEPLGLRVHEARFSLN